MKYCAVICEFNPFHSGHAYLLDRARRLTGADGIIAVMSGDFVQRAEPAIADRFVRAHCAVLGGADMVIELPVSTAIAAGRDFARGAVEVVTKLADVGYLVMGCEDDRHIVELADIQLSESDGFRASLRTMLDSGASYPAAYTAACVGEAEARGIDRDVAQAVLTKPNNLLCIEYIKALKAAGSEIEPILVKRKGSGYNDAAIGEGFASATAIRAQLLSNPQAALGQMPREAGELLYARVSSCPVRGEVFDALALSAVRESSLDDLRALKSVGEGLEYKLKEQSERVGTLNELYAAVKSKRYTMSRIKRAVLEALLRPTPSPVYRVLALREEFKHYLAQPCLYVSPKSVDLSLISSELRASRLYSLLTSTPSDSFFTTPLIVV